MEPALAGAPATVLCVYNSDRLDAEAIDCAERMHPVVIAGGEPRASAGYVGGGVIPPHCDRPLTPLPAGAARLGYRDDLRAVRDTVASCAAEAGLAPGRTTDLVLAVSEVAANTLRHTQGSPGRCTSGGPATRLSARSPTPARSPTRWRAAPPGRGFVPAGRPVGRQSGL